METLELVELAYRKFKQHVYYESVDLFLKERLAKFETSSNEEFDNLSLKQRFEKIIRIVECLKNGNELEDELNEDLSNWIERIDYNCIPKKVIQESNCTRDGEKNFITNVKSSDHYILKEINYFISAPIEIHILDVLWVMKAGIYIDSDLPDSCYWYRLNDKLQRKNDYSSHISKFYYQQYKEWRDNAISKAEDLVKREKKDIALFSMDFKRCYYCLDINFKVLLAEFFELYRIPEDEIELVKGLTSILERIHRKYEQLTKEIRSVHEGANDCKSLPIGLISSGVLCNWHLKKFDRQILEDLNPAYYGRYVDDILIVIKNPVIECENKQSPIHSFINKYLISNGILVKLEDPDNKNEIEYALRCDNKIKIKGDKIHLFEINKDHSLALLDKYKKKIQENSSAFYYLPVESHEYDLNKLAYDIYYNGSSNKIGSIGGFSENLTDLSINLSKILAVYSDCNISLKEKENLTQQIFRYYMGVNYLNFCRTWEKIFIATIISKNLEDTYKLYMVIRETINNTVPDTKETPLNDYIFEKVIGNIKNYLNISFSLAVGLLGGESKKIFGIFKKEIPKRSHHPTTKMPCIDQLNTLSNLFRETNLIKHYYVCLPLVNYTDYPGSLIDIDKIEEYFSDHDEISIIQEKIDTSPRFIHFNEYQLFCLITKLYSKIGNFHDSISSINRSNGEGSSLTLLDDYFQNIIKVKVDNALIDYPMSLSLSKITQNKGVNTDNLAVYEYYVSKDKSPKKSDKHEIKIGLANIQIKEDELIFCHGSSKRPDITVGRRKELNKLLNLANEEKCDLLVLPELSVPYRWLPFMVDYSRKHQIGLIFGMEYWNVGNLAYNLIVATLPIIDEDKYRSCCISVRCKNHYSPKEICQLKDCGYDVPKLESAYHLFKWKGLQFTIYNCYELTDINHRSIFKSELDFLIACVLNRDVGYFSNIIESVSKDLHCYVVQVNTSKYGDSRIVQPTKAEFMNILRVSGGENKTILTATINIDKLRDFQVLKYGLGNKQFKPTPAGFNRDKVHSRGKIQMRNTRVGKIGSVENLPSEIMPPTSVDNQAITSGCCETFLQGRKTYLFFDLETTGLPKPSKERSCDPESPPRIVQIAWKVCSEDGRCLPSKNYLIRPEGFTIPDEVVKIHGISQDRALQEGVDIAKALNDFNTDAEKSHTLVAHNIKYDYNIILSEFSESGIVPNFKQNEQICTMTSSAIVNYCKIPGNNGKYKWPKLAELYEILFEKKIENEHNALSDVNACSECFFKLKRMGII